MKTKRLREKLHQFLLEEGRLTTEDLYQRINRAFRHGTTMNALANCLSKDARFRKVGFLDLRSSDPEVRHEAGGGMRVAVWEAAVSLED
jgi:hypothetical protein